MWWKEVRRWKRDSREMAGSEEGENELEECMVVELGPRFIGAVDREEPAIGMTFQVAAVKKALASVWRICRAGEEGRAVRYQGGVRTKEGGEG